MRTFTKDSPITSCFTASVNPLIKISKNGKTEYFKTKRQKMDAIFSRKKTDKFIIAWCGEWSTDVFTINDKDINTLISNYG